MAGDTMLTAIVRQFPNQGVAMKHFYKAAKMECIATLYDGSTGDAQRTHRDARGDLAITAFYDGAADPYWNGLWQRWPESTIQEAQQAGARPHPRQAASTPEGIP